MYRIDGGPETEFTSAFTLGEGTHVIAFRSEDKAGNLESPKTATVPVSRLALAALSGAREVLLLGSAVVEGRVESGGPIELKGSARVLGEAAGSEVRTRGEARVTGTITNGFSLHPRPIDLGLLSSLAEANQTNDRIPAGFLRGKELVVDSNRILSLPAGTYVVDELKVRGKLEVLGPAHLLVKGAVRVSGEARVNIAGKAKDLIVVSASSSAARLAGESRWAGLLYAPLSGLEISGEARAWGHLFGDASRVLGEARVQAGEPEPRLARRDEDEDDDGGKRKARTTELGADQSFSLKCQVIYPNPARKGAGVVIRVCAGPSDSMEVEVKDVFGRVVHRGNTGPARVVDRNGVPTYVNDYSWAAALRPGVYAYNFTVHKAGSPPIRGSGRFAVTP
jgi:hypothetical protein